MNKCYAGIGSRKTPFKILQLMTSIAKSLDDLGYVLRSGGAFGADTAFAKGAVNKEIYTEKDSIIEAENIASKTHPAWYNCNRYARKLLGRNVLIVLGKDLKSPVDFVVCWTAEGKNIGGTGLTVSLARSNSIPVYNLVFKSDIEKLFIEQLGSVV